MAPKPPTMTNSISASNSRCSSRLSSFTKVPAYSFQFQRECECLLMLKRTLFV